MLVLCANALGAPLNPAVQRSVGCKFVHGDGAGVSAKETYLGDMPHEECAAAVRSKVPSANGATVSKKPRTAKGNPGCWAEEGVTGVTNPQGSYMSCMFEEQAAPLASPSKKHASSVKAKFGVTSEVSSPPPHPPTLPPSGCICGGGAGMRTQLSTIGTPLTDTPPTLTRGDRPPVWAY